jgi:hypothetical protein
MDGQTIIRNIKLGLDKTSSLELPSFTNEELVYWANEAQQQLIKQKVFGNNYRKEGYDEGRKRYDDLRTLVKYTIGLTPVAHAYHPNISSISISSNIPDYLYFIGADARLTNTDETNELASNYKIYETKLIKEDDIGQLVETPFNKPFLKNVYVYLKENQVNFIYDPNSTLNTVYVSYIKEPRAIAYDTDTATNIGSELPEHVHSEIVALAVNLLLENIESPRLKTNELLLTKKE